jgi:hypothetical protein
MIINKQESTCGIIYVLSVYLSLTHFLAHINLSNVRVNGNDDLYNFQSDL